MTTIRVETRIEADPATVWEDLRDISSHVEWMVDAVAIDFVGDTREGVGVTFDCATRVGPFRLTDRMETTDWVPAERMGVRHVGLVRGEGCFTLSATGDGATSFVWEEELRFPWWLGGPLGSIASKPVLRFVWRRNLDRLASRFD